MTKFWSNTIWYIALLATSIIAMALVLKKSQNRKFTIAFTLAILGFLYLMEAVLIITFDAYDYFPGIVDDQFQDTVLGNIFSQLSISSTALLIITYELSYKWYFFFATAYSLIEELFLKLGVFKHHWYRSIYTFVGLLLLFWFIKACHKKMIASQKRIALYIPLFLGVFAAAGNTIMLPLKLAGIQVFIVNFYGMISKNHTTTAIIYGFFLINILINLVIHNVSLAWKGAVFVILFFVQYALYASGALYIADGWFIPLTLACLAGFYFWVVVLNRFLIMKKFIH